MKAAVREFLHGAARSWTVWFSTALALVPELLNLLKDNWTTVAPFVPDGKEKAVLQVIALIVLLLRLRTNASLNSKGADVVAAKEAASEPPVRPGPFGSSV